MNERHIALLREAYVQDVIDLETLEEFTALVVEDKPVALPAEVLNLHRLNVPRTDEPGAIFYYNPAHATPTWG